MEVAPDHSTPDRCNLVAETSREELYEKAQKAFRQAYLCANAQGSNTLVEKDSRKGAKLTPKQAAFVDEYLVDLNATKAAIRAGYSEKTAGQQGERLLKNVEIQAALSERMKDRQERTKITQDMVLKRWWELATANPNELVQFRRENCRHCHGSGHEFQWVDRAEYESAVAAAKVEAEANGGKPIIPSAAGGFGFQKTADPHPGCPKCGGEGFGRMHAMDTRKLTGPALLLYDGVKQTKEGLEIKMQDRGKALENVARHLGMFNDKLTLRGEAENPLRMLLEQVQGTPMRPAGADDEQ